MINVKCSGCTLKKYVIWCFQFSLTLCTWWISFMSNSCHKHWICLCRHIINIFCICIQSCWYGFSSCKHCHPSLGIRCARGSSRRKSGVPRWQLSSVAAAGGWPAVPISCCQLLLLRSHNLLCNSTICFFSIHLNPAGSVEANSNCWIVV